MTDLPSALAPWMSRQRWYGNKGGAPVLEELGSVTIPSADPTVRIITRFVLDLAQGTPALYQVPLTYRSHRVDGSDAALVGEEPSGDYPFIYDGPHDGAYSSALLELIVGERALDGDRAELQGTRAWAAEVDGFRSRVLTGEQSNTSIIFESPSGRAPIICKVFRALHAGENPDVELQSALALAGSGHVPRPIGSITGEWPDSGEPGGRARGHLAFAQEFLPGVEDAWRVALRAAAANDDFTDSARALGVATAEVHATLAAAMPSATSTPADIAAVLSTMRGRLELAMAEVPAIEEHRDALETVFELARSVPWPARQRIHGDYHLGQVLSVHGRGWVLVDFEGEPLRPMRERSQLDFPLRDIAGMLRSFDYVAGSLAQASPSIAASSWASAARRAFVDGYISASGYDVRAHRVLLDAFEIDKALYETVYEARNRPDWVGIPVAAIGRLAHRSSR